MHKFPGLNLLESSADIMACRVGWLVNALSSASKTFVRSSVASPTIYSAMQI